MRGYRAKVARIAALLWIASGIAAVQGCRFEWPAAGSDVVAKKEIDQSKLCRFSSDDEASACVDGQLSFFQPQNFGNQQLPLLAAAGYCDFNYQVMFNDGGVICVFTSKRMKGQK